MSDIISLLIALSFIYINFMTLTAFDSYHK